MWHELISKDICMNFVNIISSLPFVIKRVQSALRILVMCFYFDRFRPVCPNVVLVNAKGNMIIIEKQILILMKHRYKYVIHVLITILENTC
jgi:hypothetical protein